jgi:hypothetical protein
MNATMEMSVISLEAEESNVGMKGIKKFLKQVQMFHLMRKQTLSNFLLWNQL